MLSLEKQHLLKQKSAFIVMHWINTRGQREYYVNDCQMKLLQTTDNPAASPNELLYSIIT